MSGDEAALVINISNAFASNVMPAEAIHRESVVQFDSDVEDALWFSGRDWREITVADWRDHMSAFTFMSNEAAAYYLPSLLILSAQNPKESINSLDSLIYELDCTPELGIRDERIRARFLGLPNEAYEAIKEWLLFMSENAPDLGYGTSGPGDRFGRIFEVIDLIQQESEALNTIRNEDYCSG